MIPVVSIDKTGELGYQVFNDVLTPQEQINRKVLDALFYAQTKITNENTKFSQLLGKGELTDAELATLNTAAGVLNAAIKSAVDTFAAAVEAAK